MSVSKVSIVAAASLCLGYWLHRPPLSARLKNQTVTPLAAPTKVKPRNLRDEKSISALQTGNEKFTPSVAPLEKKGSDISDADMINFCDEFRTKWHETHIASRVKMLPYSEESNSTRATIEYALERQAEISKSWSASTAFTVGSMEIKLEMTLRLGGRRIENGKEITECSSLSAYFVTDGTLESTGEGGCGITVRDDTPVFSMTTFYYKTLNQAVAALIIPYPVGTSDSTLEFLPRDSDKWQSAGNLAWRPISEAEVAEIETKYHNGDEYRSPASN
jgi:hypothetical protein